jgi:hypothetical protein
VEVIVKLEINIRGVWKCGFIYEVYQIKDQDLILGLPWLKDTGVRIKLEGLSLFFP